MSVKSGAESIAEAARAATKKGGLPPVHLWNPPFCGDFNMELRADGTWFYEGTPIGRPALVRLFSSILRKEGAKYFLVTPGEKVGIRVVDAPFVATDADVAGEGAAQTITFTTQTGDTCTAGPDHPIRVERDPDTEEPRPYVLVRAELEALIDRKTFYRLVEAGAHHEVGGTSWFGLWSSGAFFPVIPSAELK